MRVFQGKAVVTQRFPSLAPVNRLIMRGQDIFCASGGENFGQIARISPGVRYGFADIGGVGPELEIRDF